MFRFACFVLIALSQPLFAQNLRWADLVESRVYKIDREIRLSHNKTEVAVSANDAMRLLDFRPLPMINVFLAEFKLLRCSNSDFVSEMVLVEIEQSGGEPVAVGVDMAEKCVLEIFLEKKDYNALSIFR